MKLLPTLFFLAFSLCSITAFAQFSHAYCGLIYTYDNAGNRIQRSENPCSDDSRMLVMADTINKDSLSTQNLQETLYPNPTAGPFYVVFNNNVSDAQLTITDNLGRQVYNAFVSGATIPVDISAFSPGMYYITVRTGGNSYTNGVFKN